MVKTLKFIVSIAFLFSFNYTFAQLNKTIQNEIIIIGTIHFPTKNINADTIYNAIQKVNPNVVLLESGKSYFNSNGTFKENNFEENEWMASNKYFKNFPLTKFFPFDIEERDALRKKLEINGDNPLFDYVYLQDSLNKLSQINKTIVNRFNVLNQFCDTIYNGSLKKINCINADNTLHERQFYQYFKFTELANSIAEIKNIKSSANSKISLFEYNKRWSDFELQRNFEMSENIINNIIKNPGKKIVVLVGFYHRFSIIETLKLNQTKFNFKIKEYYEF